jgi:5'-3' exonuclease
MILLDFSQVCLSNILASGNKDFSVDLIRHQVLNSIRGFKSRFSKYGELVICCDDKNYWRKKIFPYYKASRKKTREESNLDWAAIFNTLHTIKAEIKDNLPYAVLQVETAEADDIIAVMVERYSNEKIMIVSGDKDFIQLHKYNNVRQYSPITKKHINGVDPVVYIKEHILKGDRSDGIPNVLSPDHTFTDALRQRPLTSKRIESILAQEIDELDNEVKRNYQRNNRLINLDNIPEELEKKILDDFNVATSGDRSKLLNYFIDKRLKSLTEQIGEF